MTEPKGKIIVGVLGQWASGKTEAARTLIRHLGGEDQVAFLTDRQHFVGQGVKYLLELGDDEIWRSVEEDGRQRVEGELAMLWLEPGEDLETADICSLRGHFDEEIIPVWHNQARTELAVEIRERSMAGKPVIIEAAFGPRMVPTGGMSSSHTIADLFMRFEAAGLAPEQVRWIIVKARYDTRFERNARRSDTVPADSFAQFASDGGDLDVAQQREWEERGATIHRLRNDHDDIGRFRSEVIAAFEEIYEVGLGNEA